MSEALTIFDFVWNYGRYENGDEDEIMVRALMAAAEIYLSSSGVAVDDNDELYRLAVAGLVLYWFDHRDAVCNEAQIPQNVRPLINQLKMMNGAVT